MGDYFGHQIDDLSEAQLTDYFSDLIESHSWSTVKLDLYGLKFYTTHVLHKPMGHAQPDRSQRQALAAMKQCRTALAPCSACDETRLLPHSCGRWPGSISARSTAILFDCAWATLSTFSRNDKQLQGTPGAVAVLHTHSRRLDYHPHVHLGRYLYRGVVQEKDILACKNGQVRFRYRDGKTGKRVVRTVSGAAFRHLVLQHVLPKGFRRARNYGFLHPNSKRLIALLRVVRRRMPPVSPHGRARPKSRKNRSFQR